MSEFPSWRNDPLSINPRTESEIVLSSVISRVNKTEYETRGLIKRLYGGVIPAVSVENARELEKADSGMCKAVVWRETKRDFQ